MPTVKFVTSLYYSTVSAENIGTSREIITELSNLIMTVLVAYAKGKPARNFIYCFCDPKA